MEQYTIYCTPEQTRKALELGAPIEVTFECSEHKEPLMQYNSRKYLCPTAEQMIGWLETQDSIGSIELERTNYPIAYWEFCIWLGSFAIDVENRKYTTRKEATLAAIDTALDYLIKNKK